MIPRGAKHVPFSRISLSLGRARVQRSLKAIAATTYTELKNNLFTPIQYNSIYRSNFTTNIAKTQPKRENLNIASPKIP